MGVVKDPQRKIAKDLGEKTYESNRQCTKCREYIRYTCNYSCYKCTKEEGFKKLNDNELMAKYRTPEKVNKKTRLWRQKNPEAVKNQRKRSNSAKREKYKKSDKRSYKHRIIKRLYGIGIEEYEIMLHEQNSACKICGKTQKQNLAIDHCHKTKTVRGLLCSKCNLGLGHFNDDIKRLQNAIDYIRSFACL